MTSTLVLIQQAKLNAARAKAEGKTPVVAVSPQLEKLLGSNPIVKHATRPVVAQAKKQAARHGVTLQSSSAGVLTGATNTRTIATVGAGKISAPKPKVQATPTQPQPAGPSPVLLLALAAAGVAALVIFGGGSK